VRQNPGMATDASTPLPLRISAADRERAARMLRDGSVEGRMSLDTFSERIERVYRARSQDDLSELVSDVRPAGAARRTLLRLVEWVSRLDAEVEAAWERPRVPVIALPTRAARLTIAPPTATAWSASPPFRGTTPSCGATAGAGCSATSVRETARA
jgi:hypothetical protein